MPAMIAALAALGGVAVGVMLEPVRLAAARRAQVRQDRIERCVRLLELANDIRHQVLDISRIFHGRRPAVDSPEWERWERLNLPLYQSRAQLRAVAGVLRIYGPSELAQGAESVRRAASGLSAARFAQGVYGESDDLPASVLGVVEEFNGALDAFADVAARYVG